MPKPLRALTPGEYHCNGDSRFTGAWVASINRDDTVNLKVLRERGHEEVKLNVSLEDNADEGVHFFRPYED